ncbi:MAG TPA: TolC family protein [Candidatus Binatia bacterium]|nr:TolC family protein [Candidatus Binatia bacterium]
MSLSGAVELALSNYPAVRAAQAQAGAARAGIDLARTAYLPHTDLLWQENRATRNNVFGLLLPQSVIPSISGPVLGTKSYTSTWGSAGGVLFSWEPFDFGLRSATVALARTVTAQAEAGVEVTRLDVATAAADAFLAVLAAEQAVRAAQANVDRLQVFAQSVHVLVQQQLRPGADASRADAELAAARNQLIQAQQAMTLNQATLAEALGVAGTTVATDPGPLLELPPASVLPPPQVNSHPLARAQAAAVETVRAREHVLDRSYVPRLNLQASFSGRGTGAQLDGRLIEGKGLLPDTPNWAAGVSVSFPLFDIFALRARRQAEASNEEAERARYAQTIQSLTAQDVRARAVIEAAQRIADNTPLQLTAAQAAETQVRTRYQFGLATVTDVADVQRLLAQAETDNAVARLGVWRALLAAARSQGDLTPFLQYVANSPSPRSK